LHTLCVKPAFDLGFGHSHFTLAHDEFALPLFDNNSSTLPILDQPFDIASKTFPSSTLSEQQIGLYQQPALILDRENEATRGDFEEGGGTCKKMPRRYLAELC
jgi:hypothetical protein